MQLRERHLPKVTLPHSSTHTDMYWVSNVYGNISCIATCTHSLVQLSEKDPSKVVIIAELLIYKHPLTHSHTPITQVHTHTLSNSFIYQTIPSALSPCH